MKMEKAYLIAEGYKEVIDQVYEILLKLTKFTYHPWFDLYKVFQLPEWWTQREHKDFLDTLERIRVATSVQGFNC